MAECLDWTPWRKAFGIKSAGGGYTMEYIFYILYSVSIRQFFHCLNDADIDLGFLRCVRKLPSQDLRHICKTQWNP